MKYFQNKIQAIHSFGKKFWRIIKKHITICYIICSQAEQKDRKLSNSFYKASRNLDMLHNAKTGQLIHKKEISPMNIDMHIQKKYQQINILSRVDQYVRSRTKSALPLNVNLHSELSYYLVYHFSQSHEQGIREEYNAANPYNYKREKCVRKLR